tara:strand:+ start:102 stop:482 length:381 start_codon:yes stop_codon:yes gene_type:complete
LRTYSTSEFEIRIDDGLLEMRSEGKRMPQTGSDGERAFNSLLQSESIQLAAFDIRAADFDFSKVELESRIRHIGRQCRGIPLAFIGRGDQQDQLRAALHVINQMDGIARTFRSRGQALAWLRSQRA